jgi:hypothetical protein
MVVLAGFDHGASRDESMEVISKRKMRKLDWAFVLLGLLDGRRLRFLRDTDDVMDGISGGTLRQV